MANVDADAAENRDLAQKYGVGSFPTIKFFPKDKKGTLLFALAQLVTYDTRRRAP